MAIFNLSAEPKVSTISKFTNASVSGILKPGERFSLPLKGFHNRKILITNTGRSVLQIYRTHSATDIVPIESVTFYPGEVKKIMPKELGNLISGTTIIFNPDNSLEGGFAMSYI